MSYVVAGVELGRVTTALDAGASAATPSLVTYRTTDSAFSAMTERRRAAAAAASAAADAGGSTSSGSGSSGSSTVVDTLMAQGAALLQRLGTLTASFTPADYAAALAAFRASVGLPAGGVTTQADLDALSRAVKSLEDKASSGLPAWVLPAAVIAFLVFRK